MLSTAVSILAAIALLMPGFIIAEVSIVRAARSSRSDLELALRALTYTLIVHLVFGFWTAHLIKSVGPLGRLDGPCGSDKRLRRDRPPRRTRRCWRVAQSLSRGGRLWRRTPQPVCGGTRRRRGKRRIRPRHQRWRKDGVWIIVELVGHTADSPRLVGGTYGRRSAFGQTPQPHDIFLEALCRVEVDLVPEGPVTL